MRHSSFSGCQRWPLGYLQVPLQKLGSKALRFFSFRTEIVSRFTSVPCSRSQEKARKLAQKYRMVQGEPPSTQLHRWASLRSCRSSARHSMFRCLGLRALAIQWCASVCVCVSGGPTRGATVPVEMLYLTSFAAMQTVFRFPTKTVSPQRESLHHLLQLSRESCPKPAVHLLPDAQRKIL